MDHLVNKRMTPAIRSSNDSNVDATMANDLLFIEAIICTCDNHLIIPCVQLSRKPQHL
jgi:hypothetical protein